MGKNWPWVYFTYKVKGKTDVKIREVKQGNATKIKREQEAKRERKEQGRQK